MVPMSLAHGNNYGSEPAAVGADIIAVNRDIQVAPVNLTTNLIAVFNNPECAYCQ